MSKSLGKVQFAMLASPLTMACRRSASFEYGDDTVAKHNFSASNVRRGAGFANVGANGRLPPSICRCGIPDRCTSGADISGQSRCRCSSTQHQCHGRADRRKSKHSIAATRPIWQPFLVTTLALSTQCSTQAVVFLFCRIFKIMPEIRLNSIRV